MLTINVDHRNSISTGLLLQRRRDSSMCRGGTQAKEAALRSCAGQRLGQNVHAVSDVAIYYFSLTDNIRREIWR